MERWSSPDSNPELESFREQWKAEVRAKVPAASGPSSSSQKPPPQQQKQKQHASSSRPAHSTIEHPRKPPPPPSKVTAIQEEADDDDDDVTEPEAFQEPVPQAVAPLSTLDQGEESGSIVAGKGKGKEPVTALEHYERAVEREVAGNLGDSLELYRKAFRMDDRVDQLYRMKHFPRPPPKPAQATSPPAVPTTAATKPEQPQSMKELIASFPHMAIEPAQPEIKGMPEPPCPIASLPDEILVHILRDVALLDVGDFVRLAQVCKRLAYLVATEDQIWRRVCLGPEWGFGGMHYHWQRGITWEPLSTEDLVREAAEKAKAEAEAQGEAAAEDDIDNSTPLVLTLEERAQQHAKQSDANTMIFFHSLYGSSWQRMFRLRPRIRFNGCYICTVNYIRAGQAAANQLTWGSPVHIVTYYRYLRFFRDGTAISLLTTTEPADVVHHLTREAVALHAGGAAPHLPGIVMQSALKGRWRLETVGDNAGATVSEAEGNVVVETEGVSKYVYRLSLALRYNRLTDDWAEFVMRDNKPFIFSRVRGYGVMGE
ncbi:hypothetical protein B0T17DRAFT_607135 [Bombardia bombarda]|uniref:F-box domain-containing protein n=1 Tax=Bombardia bombarda TaxID=252184 RepID=A0AA40C9J1_9PEZI|nr:hypothetical protein B0T17DRAFT_607135 [Bombardia bombarda]